jgi:nicotinate dehydrogenase subunit A
MGTCSIHINGIARSVACSDPGKPLLYALRNLGFTVSKFGSDLGQYGACNVLVDGRATRSCVETIASSQEKSVVTLEGLGSMTAPHPVKVALIKEQVPRALWRWY